MTLRMPSLGCTASRCWKKRHGVGNRPWGKTSSPGDGPPPLGQRVDAGGGGLAAVAGGVDGSHRRAVDGVGGDAPGHERLEHADLGRAPGAAAGEDEGGADTAPQHPGPAVAGEPPPTSCPAPASRRAGPGPMKTPPGSTGPGVVTRRAPSGVGVGCHRGLVGTVAVTRPVRPVGPGRHGHAAPPSGRPRRPGPRWRRRRRRRPRRRRRSCRELRPVPGGARGHPRAGDVHDHLQVTGGPRPTPAPRGSFRAAARSRGRSGPSSHPSGIVGRCPQQRRRPRSADAS